MASSSRGRDRRGEYRPTFRRSRSPMPSKRRSFSPPVKRKALPVRERDILIRPKESKSPIGPSRGSDHYKSPEPSSRIVINVSSTQRFGESEHEEEGQGRPQFRGPERSMDYGINELKKFTVEIMRKPSSVHGDYTIKRNITNPEDIAPVRRPDEGAIPMFLRGADSSKSKEKVPSDDYRRIVAIDNSRSSGGRDRAHSRERSPSRYSPVPGPSHYEDHRKTYYSERERGHSPYEGRHRSPHRDEYMEPRDKPRERMGGIRGGLRRDSVVRNIEERRYSPERRLSFERDHRERGRESDLRNRISEKRSNPHHHPRIEERERERRYEGDRGRGDRRSHQSFPPRGRRRPGSLERAEMSRNFDETWERDREREGRDRGSSHQEHSREREHHEHSDHYNVSRHSSSSHKNVHMPKKFFKSHESKDFIPPPVRGRGFPNRRGIPPFLRGRGSGRGFNRENRGGVMVSRGMPRSNPYNSRGFPPRPPSFLPPY